ncbi:MAG TPA: glycosyl hydrolase family 8, partial [Phenylobacterium sp.]|nr:glycosyl hydrolase family 8 [Phenylobacterium sp.]
MGGELNRRHAVTGALALGAGLAAPVAACATVNGEVDWREFKRRFLAADGRIIDTGNGGISHSEGQGFALLLAQAHGDRRAFDLIWGWTRRTLQRPDGLFAWRYDPRENPAVNDPNNATDGDIFLA